MASLVDTNVLVYRCDPRDPQKRRVAIDLLRGNLVHDTLVLPHQAILEFIAAVTRPRPDLGLVTADSVHELPPLYADEPAPARRTAGLRSPRPRQS